MDSDELVSRIFVYGTLILVAVFVLGAVVVLGLEDDETAAPIATTSTQTTATQTTATQTTARTTTQPRPTPATEPPATTPETSPAPVADGVDDCSDGIDNDGDDLVDAAQDDGCLRDRSEAPANDPSAEAPARDPSADEPADRPPARKPRPRGQCDDGIDNDDDGLIDDQDSWCPGKSESRPPGEPR